MALSIASYNVNGIRAALRKDIIQWLKDHPVDILCLQETKAQPEQVPAEEFEALGYQHFWHSAEKKGYSGVATFTKVQPTKVEAGCGIEAYDREGRILRTDFGDWTLLNCYFPSGTTGDVRQDFKMEFLADFRKWIEKLREERPKLIIVGDYNIANTEMDIHNPKSNKNTSGFLPEEREWLTDWFNDGFVDAFRYLHPEKIAYSWWSYRARARENNKGWRIDYQSISENLKDKLQTAYQVTDAVHSDHCPVYIEIDL
ncbi:MAG TPA: exodeoxyribonuclease III [Saprospiraceae bacterium]|nr:exodeoxyribonuclease III [Saprospiraceae bacterium]